MPKQSIEQLEKELERLQKLVHYDELTDVLNRRGFKEEAEKAFRAVSFGRSTIERRIGFQIPFSIIFLDIDNFKKINDTYGHDAGDTVLQKVAGILHNRLRISDLFGRWGGEEFIIALLGANIETAKAVAEQLREGIEHLKIPFKGERLTVTASLGITEYNNEKDLSELINKADKAMYNAKQKGKNRVIVFGND